jgi:hypothetical protein
MGLMDKVKSQAAVATAAAKEAAQKGQAKLDDIQSKRAADAILRDLGATLYAEKTGRQTSATEMDQERLVTALQHHEELHGPISLVLESPAATMTDGPQAS